MTSSGDTRSRNEDLAALRIDRKPPSSPRRPLWRRPLAISLVVVVALLASLGLARWMTARPPIVEVAYARAGAPGAGPTGVAITGSGYVVTGERYISLGVRVPGRIEEYLVEEGQRVEEGQALVRLDDRRYASALREARAQLREGRANAELKRKELDRARELHAKGVSSNATLDLRETESSLAVAKVETLEARIAQLELDLEDTRLVSPVNGVVLEKLKEVGEIAVPGGFAGSGDLIRLANTDEMRAEIDVNEADLSKISMGQPARVIPDAYPDRRYAAEVIKLYPQINRQKGTLRVEVRILEPDAFLRPDMSARIDFLREAAEPASGEISVLVPSEALRGGDEGRFVWLVTEGQVRRRPVEIGSSPTSDPVVVSRGLDGGEALVTSDASELEEGSRVEIAPSS
jgi:RND family efflux transporter MFP subunit